MLFGNIFCFEEAIISDWSSKTKGIRNAQQLNTSRYATSKKSTNGEKVRNNFISNSSMSVSLAPYFAAIIIASHCTSCGEQNWFSLLLESSVVFLFLNSAANPFLTTFRIRELKKSVKIVLHLTQAGNEISLDDFRQQHSLLRNSNFVSLWVAQTPSPDKFTLGYRLSCKSQRESRKAKPIITLLKHLSRAALHMNVNWIQNHKNWELDNQSNLCNFKLFNCN